MPIDPKPYRASLSRNQGRKSYAIIFRHPVRKDPHTGKSGWRVRAGLGTTDEIQANQLREQMNQLLANSDYWEMGARETARGRFDERIVDIFFRHIKPEPTDFMKIRDEVIPIPSSDDSDYRSALLLGTTGVGKTTLLRQIIGTDPEKERFPSTSTAKTTVADTEIIVAEGEYRSVVTFMERDKVRDYLEQCLSKAILTAYEQKPKRDILNDLLHHAKQRMRFTYILGDGPALEGDSEEDEEDVDEENDFGELNLAPEAPENINLDATNELLADAIERAKEIARNQGEKIKTDLDATDEPEDQRVIDDLFEEEIDRLVRDDEDYHVLVDGLMDEIELRFSTLTQGSLRKTKGGWPVSWQFSSSNRDTFIEEIRRLSSNHAPLFGRLLTPLVNGIRVQGPFFPTWDKNSKRPIVIIDGEGLGHTPDSSASLSTKLTRRIDTVDAVVLVDNAMQPMQAAPAAALHSLASTGHIGKLLICFTHFDQVKGDNLPNARAKRDHVLNSAKNVMTDLGKDFGASMERVLKAKLDEQCFFVGGIHKRLDQEKSKGSIGQIKLLLAAVGQIGGKPEPVEARPVYDRANLTLAIRKAAEQFHQEWPARLGLEYKPGINKEHWTRIKALTRRFAIFGEDEYDTLRPVADLHQQLAKQIRITIETPIRWEGDRPDEDSQQQVYDELASKLSDKLLDLSSRRVKDDRSAEWEKAFYLSGRGSTFVRAYFIAEDIYRQAAPVPDQTPSPGQNAFLHEVLALVKETCQELKIKLE